MSKRKLLLPSLAFLAALLATTAQAQLTPEQQLQLAQLRQVQAMSTMFDLRASRLGLEETVAAVRAAAEKRQWRLAPTVDMGASMSQSGVKDAPHMKVIPTCPRDANERIAKVTAGKSPPLPCRITVFADQSGKVHLIKFNTAHFAKAAKGELATLMAEIAAEEESLLKGIVE